MSNGNKRNRGGNQQGGGGGGGGGGNQQRRRRSGGQGGQNRPQAPTGPAMTALGESTYEAVFDHGGQGYGVWFDGVVRDDPMYKQFWKGTGTRPLFVRIEEDKIVLLKQLDRELPPSMQVNADDEGDRDDDGNDANDDVDVDAAIEEAVAEAMAAAEAAAAETTSDASSDASSDAAATDSDGKVYSPEEAAALFAAGDESGDAPDVTTEAEAEAPAKPKRKPAVRRKPAAKKVAPKDDAGDE